MIQFSDLLNARDEIRDKWVKAQESDYADPEERYKKQLDKANQDIDSYIRGIFNIMQQLNQKIIACSYTGNE